MYIDKYLMTPYVRKNNQSLIMIQCEIVMWLQDDDRYTQKPISQQT